MKLFTAVVLGWMGLEAFLVVFLLGMGQTFQPTKLSMALTVFINSLFVIWAAVLLAAA